MRRGPFALAHCAKPARFAGAAQELRDALIVNPYDAEQLADSIRVALEMDPEEQSARMRRMRETLREHNIYRSGRAQTAQEGYKPATGPETPEIVYVTDFAIDTGNIGHEGSLLNRPRRRQEDPEAKAKKLVELLSSALTKEVQNKSVFAQRLLAGQTIPDRGW